MNDRTQTLAYVDAARGGVASQEQRNRVLRNTYWLLALSLLPTVLGAWIGVSTGITRSLSGGLGLIVFMVGAFWDDRPFSSRLAGLCEIQVQGLDKEFLALLVNLDPQGFQGFVPIPIELDGQGLVVIRGCGPRRLLGFRRRLVHNSWHGLALLGDEARREARGLCHHGLLCVNTAIRNSSHFLCKCADTYFHKSSISAADRLVASISWTVRPSIIEAA